MRSWISTLLNVVIACDFVVLYMLFLCILDLVQVFPVYFNCREAGRQEAHVTQPLENSFIGFMSITKTVQEVLEIVVDFKLLWR